MFNRFLLLLSLLAPGSVAQQGVEVESFEEFAIRIEESIGEGDSGPFRQAFDVDAFMGAIFQGVEVDPDVRTGFQKGLASNLNLGQQIIDANVSYDGVFRFLRVLPGEPKRALFRLTGDQGLNYHEFYLRRGKDGGVSITDAFIYMSGENLSATIRRSVLAALSERDRGLIGRLLGRESEMVKASSAIAEMQQKAGSDPEGAEEIYQSLHEDVRNDPTVMLLRLQFLAFIGMENYHAGVAEFVRRHPDSPALLLMSVDYEAGREDYAAALRRVDEIEKRVLGDPYLDIVRGRLEMQRGDFAKARELTLAAVEQDLRLQYEATWQLLDVSLVEGDHEETLSIMLQLEFDFGVEWQDLGGFEAFAGFVASPHYQDWMKRHDSSDGDE